MPTFEMVHLAPVWEETTTRFKVSEEQAKRIREGDEKFVLELFEEALLDPRTKVHQIGEVSGIGYEYTLEERPPGEEWGP